MRLRAPTLLLALLIALPAANAFDAKVESQAKGLQKKAMDEDYLGNVNLQAAETKLTQALTICKNKCSPQLRALLYRDLATILTNTPSRFADAVAAYTEALNLSPSIRPDPNLTTPGTNGAFTAAQRAYASRIVDAGGQ